MTARTAKVTATPTTAPSTFLTPKPVVALPPSSGDPAANLMRLRIDGAPIVRYYDPDSQAH